jgi:serine phosphatase RsbU (regulator of sigma subunit)
MTDGTDRKPAARRRPRVQDGAGTDRPLTTRPSARWRRRLRAISIVAAALIDVAAVSIALAAGLDPRRALVVGLVLAAGFFVIWGALRLLRRLLWRVGRRLAFTYFLIGVLPIPMAVFLLAVVAYLMGGFFLGHLFRDALAVVQQEVASAVDTRLEEDPATLATAPAAASDVAFAYYSGGRRVSGDERAPVDWPDWLEPTVTQPAAGADQRDRAVPLVALPDGTLSLAVARRRGPSGVVAFFAGDLEARLRALSGVWIELEPSGDSGPDKVMDVTILGQRFFFQPLSRERGDEDLRQFLTEPGGHPPRVWIHGFDVAGRLLAFDTGDPIAAALPAALVGTPATVLQRLFSSSREVDTVAWLTFVVPAFLLFDVFAVAWIMALFMIFGLSRAVNRLSEATSALQRGDLAFRIPVGRTDQIGALHASFNEMAASLEDLIATKAQKETLEKELQIARDVQESLIPKGLVKTAEVEFATHFEPSAAIGGDYFDILRVDDSRLAIVVADVSGHGLSAGLRMAMIKAALSILVEEEEEPAAILGRLDRLLRSSAQEGRSFVTATLAFLDLVAGRLEIVNAGHPPTYLLRGGGVREILLPGSPLGALGTTYGSTEIGLEPGDALVWLSDGFIEATDPGGEVFGYDRTLSSLQGDCDTPSLVRDRLLDCVARHTAGEAPADDRTMVVMRFHGLRKAAAFARTGASAAVSSSTAAS